MKFGMSLKGIEIGAGDHVIVVNDETNERREGVWIRTRELDNGFAVYIRFTNDDGSPSDEMYFGDPSGDWNRLSDSNIYTIYPYGGSYCIKG